MTHDVIVAPGVGHGTPRRMHLTARRPGEAQPLCPRAKSFPFCRLCCVWHLRPHVTLVQSAPSTAPADVGAPVTSFLRPHWRYQILNCLSVQSIPPTLT